MPLRSGLVPTLLILALVILAACSQATPTPTARPTPAPSPTATLLAAIPPTPTATPTPPATPESTPTPPAGGPPSPAPQYLTEEIPPCTPISGFDVDPCEPDVKIEALGGRGLDRIFDHDRPFTVRDFLDGSSIGFIPHIVLRGTYIPDTVRCTSGNPYRIPTYIEPGYTQHSILFQCYADVRVNGYVLGAGPARLTVQVSFLHYWDYARSAADLGITEQELIEQFVEAFTGILETGYDYTGGIYGREVVLFIGPGHNQAIEVWEVFDTWDVQRRKDGTVITVHPHRDNWRGARPDDYQAYRSQLEMELPAFAEVVRTAHEARVSEYGGRTAPEDIQSRATGTDLPMLVTDANNLQEFFRDTGAYEHPDGPPAQPPPAYTGDTGMSGTSDVGQSNG